MPPPDLGDHADDFEHAVRKIVGDALAAVKVSERDRDALALYGVEIATLAAKAKLSKDPAEKDALLRSLQGFQDAISAVAARYGVRAGAAADRAADEARDALLRVLAGLGKALALALA